jgi:hypothetical protein
VPVQQSPACEEFSISKVSMVQRRSPHKKTDSFEIVYINTAEEWRRIPWKEK